VKDAVREARLAWDISWAFSLKTRPIGTSTGFKYLTDGGHFSVQCLKSVFYVGGEQMICPGVQGFMCCLRTASQALEVAAAAKQKNVFKRGF
jgi:hypothetical protein